MTIATLGFGAMTVMVKLTNRELPPQELVFWRALFSLGLLFPMVIRAKHALIVSARKTMLLRSVLGFTAMLLYFYALGRLSLAEATILVKLQPVWIALLAPLIVGDRPGRLVLLALALSIGGLAIIFGTQLTSGVVSLAGAAALAGSLLSALAHLEIRRLGRTEHPDVVVLNFTLFLVLFAGALSAPVAVVPSLRHWPLLLGLALFATIGQLFMTKAYKAASAPLVATVSYMALPIAALFDWLIFETLPSVWTIAGGLLIVASGVILTRDSEPQPSKTTANLNQ